MKFRFGFFYIGYKEKLFFWEFVIMYRKILTICISMIDDSMLFAKGALILLLNFSSLILQTSKMPFTDFQLNFLEASAIKVSLVTIFAGLFYILQYFGDVLQTIIFSIIVAVNCYFTLTWLLLVLRHTMSRYSKNTFVRNFRRMLDSASMLVSQKISKVLILNFV